MEKLLSWLKETEAQIIEGNSGTENESYDKYDQLTQHLSFCQASCPISIILLMLNFEGMTSLIL